MLEKFLKSRKKKMKTKELLIFVTILITCTIDSIDCSPKKAIEELLDMNKTDVIVTGMCISDGRLHMYLSTYWYYSCDISKCIKKNKFRVYLDHKKFVNIYNGTAMRKSMCHSDDPKSCVNYGKNRLHCYRHNGVNKILIYQTNGQANTFQLGKFESAGLFETSEISGKYKNSIPLNVPLDSRDKFFVLTSEGDRNYYFMKNSSVQEFNM